MVLFGLSSTPLLFGTVVVSLLLFLNSMATTTTIVSAFFVEPPVLDCYKTFHHRQKDGRNNNNNVFLTKQNNGMSWTVQQRTTTETYNIPSSKTSLKASTTSTTDNNDNTIKIIIAGAPASGKGTQCEYITKEYGIVHLSTGDMLREAVSANTPVGILAKQYMDSGKLVPDDVIISIVQDRLKEQDCIEQGWLLDGFPRTKAQALALEQVGIVADVFLFLNVPDEIIVERVSGRRTDPVTNKIYHLTYSPPPSTDLDLLSRLVHRSDDTPEKILVRLQQFHDNVNSVLDTYSDIIVTIDGNQSPTIVSEQIMNSIEQRIGMKLKKKAM